MKLVAGEVGLADFEVGVGEVFVDGGAGGGAFGGGEEGGDGGVVIAGTQRLVGALRAERPGPAAGGRQRRNGQDYRVRIL